MINLDENKKSEAQIRMEEKLEKAKLRLQEQIKKEHRQIEDMKKKSRSLIGELFARHLPDYYNFEAAELTSIIEPAFIMPMPTKAPAAPPSLPAAVSIASMILPCCIIALELYS